MRPRSSAAPRLVGAVLAILLVALLVALVAALSSRTARFAVPPAAAASALPPKVVGGYVSTSDPHSDVTLRSIVDHTNYNLVYVAFALGVTANSGALTLDLPPGAGNPADVKSQIGYANSRGKKIIVSVGGARDLVGQPSGYRLDSPGKVEQFMASLRDFRTRWGFNGMDWDLEQGDRTDNPGIIAASQRMRAEFGPSFIICFAPGVNLASWVGAGGVLDTLGAAGWDAVGEQIYDQGLSQADYQHLIVSRMTALAKKYGASKVLLGNKYKSDNSPSQANPDGNFVDIATTKAALATLRSAGVNLRGAFHWTIQGDADVGPYRWAGSGGVGGDILARP